ncbi:DDE_Tnp_1_7 domain-containing protein [Nephila pilipes]|uniref:DDE_Tnp_1_7 domain-containing protein n=1 Tax=Nephila pilipes TaxID=299642 RepID=A0A8X6PZG8_NEPPI|nr:DDE_Tnp_1_7 domain-containing protein [Nephila pilipes]
MQIVLVFFSGANDIERLSGKTDLGTVSNTDIRLLRSVPKHINHRNRHRKSCKLPKEKENPKFNVPSGTYRENVDTFEGMEFSLTNWKDKKQVLLLSTYVGAESEETITRCDKKLKMNFQVSYHQVIKEYNVLIGGIDLMGRFIVRYRIHIKSRK